MNIFSRRHKLKHKSIPLAYRHGRNNRPNSQNSEYQENHGGRQASQHQSNLRREVEGTWERTGIVPEVWSTLVKLGFTQGDGYKSGWDTEEFDGLYNFVSKNVRRKSCSEPVNKLS